MTSLNMKLGRLLQEKNLQVRRNGNPKDNRFDGLHQKDRNLKDRVKVKDVQNEDTRDSLLPNDVRSSADHHGESPSSRLPNMSKKVKVIHTFLIFLIFIGFGLCRGIYGPTLMELARITCVSLAQISTLFTCLGVGGIAGSLVFGRLFDHFDPLILFVVSLAALAAVTTVIPWLEVIVLMMVSCAAHSFIYSGLAIGCNTTLFRLWRERSRPIFLSMHLLYTLGGFLTPLLSEPFLTSGPHPILTWSNITPHQQHHHQQQHNLTHNNKIDTRKAVNDTAKFYVPNDVDINYGNESVNIYNEQSPGYVEVIKPSISNITTSSFPSEDLSLCWRESRIYITYAILGIYLFLVSLSICVLLVYMRNKKPGEYWRDDRPPDEPICWGGASLYRLLATLFFMVFNMNVGGQETLFTGLLFTFVVEYVGFSQTQATFLVSMFFTAVAITRFSVIFISHWVTRAFYVLLFNLAGTLSASLVLAYYTTTNSLVVWVVTIVEGLCLSTMYTMGLLWAKDFVPLTAGFHSLYTIAFTCGMMVWPPLTSALMKRYGAGWFAYMNVILVLCCALAMTSLAVLDRLRFRFKMTDQKGQPELKTIQVDLVSHSMHSINTI